MKVLQIDDVAVNGANLVNFGFSNDGDRPYEVDLRVQPREGRTPTIVGGQRAARVLAFTAWPNKASEDWSGIDDFELTVHRTLRADHVVRRVLVERVPGNASTRMVAYGAINRFEPLGTTREEYHGEVTFPDGYWYAETPLEPTTNPFTVGGNADAYPTVTLTTSEVATRTNVVVTDATGQGLGGWLVGVPWANAAAKTWLWINGFPAPFRVTGGRLWFRVNVQGGKSTIVDAYHAPSRPDNEWADRMNDGGTVLDAALAAGTSVSANLLTPGRNAVSANLTWHPHISGAHAQGLPYTFGLVDENLIVLIDRTAAGPRQSLADDADSFVFTSSAELAGIGGFQVAVASGIRLPAPDGSSQDDFSRSITEQPNRPAFLKVRVGIGGFTPGTVEWRGHSASNAIDADMSGGGAEQWDEQDDGITQVQEIYDLSKFQMDWTYGGSTGEGYGRWQETDIDDPTSNPHNVYNLYSYITSGSVENGISAAADGASVSLLETSGGWTYLVTFAAGSYAGVALPFLGFSHEGHHAVLVDQAWVDANGNVLTNGAADSPANGQVAVVLRYRIRDDETWYTAWRTIVNGTPDAAEQTINVPATAFPNGAVQVAIGLESVANGETSIDWGVLRVVTNPTLTFMAGKTPTVEVAEPVDAMALDGAIRVHPGTARENRLGCKMVFVDTDLTLDCDALLVDDRTQPIKGELTYGDPTNWVVLPPGETTYELSGNVDDATFTVYERWAI